jgi:site-specific recombinase XerD
MIRIQISINLTVRIREGKGGRDGYALLTHECVHNLKRYLAIRPPLRIDDRQLFFYTEFGNRWKPTSINGIFTDYKVKAGIEKSGGNHVFGRYCAATMMTAKGFPLNIVQTLLRQKDTRSTMRLTLTQ